MKENNKVVSAKSKNTKVTKAVAKAAKQVPIIAWAVEVNGEINPDRVVGTRAFARYLRNEVQQYGEGRKAHARKIALQVIPGR